MLQKTFLKSDSTHAFALEFVKEYKFSYDELNTSGWDSDKQKQNELVRAFASEALAYTATIIDTIPANRQIDSGLVANTISIGQLNGDVHDPHYSTVLVEGVTHGIWGSFGSESAIVRELFRLDKRETQKVAPASLLQQRRCYGSR